MSVLKKNGEKNKGFTLIELLVVIAIIGILSTIIIVFYGSARIKSRDARRVADLKQIQTALELYYTDQGDYPPGDGVVLGSTNYACLNTSGWNTANCASAYMAGIPADPRGNSYIYTAASNTYYIDATLEESLSGLSGNIRVTPAGISNNH